MLVEVAGTQVTVSGSIGRIGVIPGGNRLPVQYGHGRHDVPTVHGLAGVAIVSVTASASMLIWAQIYGACSLISFAVGAAVCAIASQHHRTGHRGRRHHVAVNGDRWCLADGYKRASGHGHGRVPELPGVQPSGHYLTPLAA